MPEPPAQSEVFAEAGVRHADPVHEFWLLWRQGQRPDVRTYLQAGGQLNTLQLAAVLLVDQRERWLTGERLQAEYYLSLYPALLTDLEYCVELIYGEFLLREEVGEGPALAQYLERFPEYAPRLRQQFEFHQALESTPSPKALDTMPTREAVSRPLEAPLSLHADSSWPSVTGYQILGPLGRGGMGVVYKALQRHAKRIVALKMVSATADAGPEALARFRTEIEAVARLQHPHIVHIYEVGEHDGRPYFSMEFADDGSLAQKLSGTPVPFRRAAQLVDTLARAINHAHEQGIIHRDLTPSNVLLMADGTPKISDFGLAKLVEAEAQSAADGAPHSGFRARTQTGAILGTPSYMPPEQASGRTRETGATGDVYALGAILYETLTGRPPFRAETPLETIRQVVSEEPVPPSRLQPGLPRDLVTVCLKCLEKEPRKRYISALALAEDLRRFLEGKPIQARRTGLLERGWRWCRRNPALASATGLAAAALVAVTAISVRFALSQVRGKAELRAALHGSQRLAAELALDKGQLLGEQGDTNGALLWIAKSLNLAPADAHDFSAMARRNMAAWRGRIYPLRAILPHQGYAFSVAFTADGKTILTGSSDSTAHVWDAATGAQIRRQIGEPIPHPRGTMFSVAFSPDGKTMVSGGPDSTARLWDLVTGQLIWSRHLKETINTAAFSPQGNTVLIAWGSAYDERHGSAQLWDVATGEPLSPPLEHDRPVCAAAFSPDGNICVTESATWGDVRGRGLARFWDNHGHEVRRPLEHPHGVLRVCFTPDGTKLLTGTWDHTAKSWDLETGQQGLTLQHEAPVNGLAVSPDGKMVLTGSSDGTARLWDLSDGKPLGPPLRHPGLVACVAFSPDGKAILTGATDSAARLWGVAVNPPKAPYCRARRHCFLWLSAPIAELSSSRMQATRFGCATPSPART